MLDEFAAYELLDRLGIARAPALAVRADVGTAPALHFAYPVAVKALSAQIAHKSDLGGVALAINDGVMTLSAAH